MVWLCDRDTCIWCGYVIEIYAYGVLCDRDICIWCGYVIEIHAYGVVM